MGEGERVQRPDFRKLSLLNEQSVAYRACVLPFQAAQALEVHGSVSFLRNMLMITLAATMFLPYKWVFGLVIIGDFLGLLLSGQAKRRLKMIDILMAIFNIEVVYIFAVFSRTEEMAECMIVILSLILFYFMLCLYVGREHIERMFVLCCSILSLERLLTITVSADKWHDNRHATFQLLVFAIPLCLKRILMRKYSWKVKVIYGFLACLITITIAIPFFYDGWQVGNPEAIVSTLNDYRLPLGTALIEFAQNVMATLSTLNPVFSVCGALSILTLILLIITEALSEMNNPLTMLAAALAVAGGGVSGFLADNIRSGLWQNINLLIIFWALIAVVTAEE